MHLVSLVPLALQPPFIVTSCGHVLCHEHQHDAKVKNSTCPACNKHVSPTTGMRLGHYDIEGIGTSNALDGLKPDHMLTVLGSSVKFWCAPV